jgi:hypothetical protein
MRKEVPTNLDWVAEKSKCSLIEIFRQLTEGIERDVQKRNELREEGERVKFTTRPNGNILNVYRESWGVDSPWVYFKLEQDRIIVKDSEGNAFEATVMLNDLGECKPEINGQER